jgi:hypothetical protein
VREGATEEWYERMGERGQDRGESKGVGGKGSGDVTGRVVWW